MSKLYLFSLTLLIIGGINYGLIGILNFDLLSFIFGSFVFLTRIIYILIFLSAIYILIDIKK